MFRGTVDRAGTREGKKTSLRKTGKDKKVASAAVDNAPKTRVDPVPTLIESTRPLSTFDCGANLVNRHLEADQARVIQRAIQSGIDGVAIITNDFEKNEQSLNVSEQYPGVIYSVAGIHPNNISSKKMSDKLFLQLIAQLRGYAIKPHCIGIYVGLDYERDYGLKFPQEKFMKAQIKLAKELGLPVVMQDFGGGEGLLEVMKECRTDIERGMIYVFNSGSAMLQRFIDQDFYISFNGLLCETSDKGDQMRDFITQVPKDRLLLVTDSPNVTPQTIPDQHIRSMPNEPSNLIYIVNKAAECLQMTPEAVAKLVKDNAKKFYSLSGVAEATTDQADDGSSSTKTPPIVAAETTTTTSTTATDSKKSKSKKKQLQQMDEDEDDEDNESDNEDNDESSSEDDIDVFERLDKAELENLYYSCKKCRTKLFKHGDIVEHEQKAAVLDHTIAKPATDKGPKKCKSYFFAPTAASSWLKPRSDKQLVCPKCEVKLGSFNNLAGEQCSCGVVLHELCRIPKSRVEVVLLGEDGELVDLALLLHLDDDDSDDQESRKQKKKRLVKKMAKKSNKSNFSNYRNKDAGVSVKKTKQIQQQLVSSLAIESDED
ncbi:hypothetical protein SAMD00019534_063500 [Acytostelium subglobosum LB1]|uniref:hypothetical protein n=1 Tax=Acytostelium subglobosum LB1 TaxID=1410327 RepID=UPI00064515BC|nr:hypothetical protein SAMD00019534_063500 [Acytostelium subglobosum LB1]GAM23175.1 hypothetical protein SAMD00019534_063500 [Acytostelium subglobosum LB1]|eukprot:XP_012753624.1 hypothetical protein SAMD00019534_063500 [Acytostelium subglobosum LB1]